MNKFKAWVRTNYPATFDAWKQRKIPKASVSFEVATFITPRNFPAGLWDAQLMEEYYALTKPLGGWVGSQVNWFDAGNADLDQLNIDMRAEALHQDCKYILQSNFLNREASAPVHSFTDPAARQAYMTRVMELASLQPDVLLIGVEVNNMLLHGNTQEFEAFRSVAKTLYDQITIHFPSVQVSISFQWDLIRAMGNYGALAGWDDCLDIYSFTSYPTLFGVPTVDGIPIGYYDAIRLYLPIGARTAIAENGWSSSGFSTESEQTKFYRRLPELYAVLDPEFALISYMHDLPVPEGAPEIYSKFSSMGLVGADGKKKPAYNVVAGYS